MEITLNPEGFGLPFLAVLLSFVIAQTIKIIGDVLAGRKINLFENGGMPSSHSATVCGLAMVILIETGFSMVFLIAIVFAGITMADAAGVRREVTRHSQFLNELTRKNSFHVTGHKPLEVVVGALLGLVVPFVLYAFFA